MPRQLPELAEFDAKQRRVLPDYRTGDTVRVHYRIREGDKERVQVFEGVVTRKHRGGIGATFTVRKRSGGVGVERIFPAHSPRIEKLEIKSRGRVRRARLYFLREREGKAARLRALTGEDVRASIAPPPAPTPAPEEAAPAESSE